MSIDNFPPHKPLVSTATQTPAEPTPVHTFEEAQTPVATLNNPVTSYVEVLAVAPTIRPGDGPRVIYLNEAAKAVPVKVDPKARRVIVHPSGQIHTEY